MRTYMARINEPTGCEKIGVRSNVIEDKRPRPENEYKYITIPEPIRFNKYGYEKEDINSIMFPRQTVLETVRYVICFWMEVDRVGDKSMGYYHMINDYMEVPQGAELAEFFNVREGQEINSVLGVMPYRDELEIVKAENRKLQAELDLLKYQFRAEGGDENTLLERIGIDG